VGGAIAHRGRSVLSTIALFCSLFLLQRWTTFIRLLFCLHTGVIIVGKLYTSCLYINTKITAFTWSLAVALLHRACALLFETSHELFLESCCFRTSCPNDISETATARVVNFCTQVDYLSLRFKGWQTTYFLILLFLWLRCRQCRILDRRALFDSCVNIEVNTRFISWGTEVRKVLDSKGDLQGHSRSRDWRRVRVFINHLLPRNIEKYWHFWEILAI